MGLMPTLVTYGDSTTLLSASFVKSSQSGQRLQAERPIKHHKWLVVDLPQSGLITVRKQEWRQGGPGR